MYLGGSLNNVYIFIRLKRNITRIYLRMRVMRLIHYKVGNKKIRVR